MAKQKLEAKLNEIDKGGESKMKEKFTMFRGAKIIKDTGWKSPDDINYQQVKRDMLLEAIAFNDGYLACFDYLLDKKLVNMKKIDFETLSNDLHTYVEESREEGK